MDPKTHMLQYESKSNPLLQTESKSKIDVPVNEGVVIQLEKSFKTEIGLGEDVCTIDHMEGLGCTKQVDKEVGRIDKKDDEVLNFEVKTYMVSLNDKVISNTRGVTWSDINVQKFENKDVLSQVDGENGDLLEVKGDKYLDTIDISAEYHLSTPTKDDIEESAFFNISSNSFLSDLLLQIESDDEQLTDAPMNEVVYVEDEKLARANIGLCEEICSIDQMDGLKITKQVDAVVARVEKKDDEVVSFEDKIRVVSQDDEVTNETRGYKWSDINVAELNNKDGKSKVYGENGTSLEETCDIYHDTNAIFDENLLLFAPTKEDWESELFNISNSSFMLDPLLHIESEVEPTVDVPMNEGVEIAEGKSCMVEIGLGRTIFTIDQNEGLKNTKQVDLDIERVEDKGDEVLDFEDKAHVVSLNDHVISEARGDTGSDINIGKLENNDGISKVNGENGASLEEKNCKYHDSNDIDGENYLISSPKNKDREEISLSNISNNPFMFDYTWSSDDSGTEEEQEAFLKELEQFHKNNLMEFKPPKFYGEGLNYLKLWRQVARLGGYDQVTSRKMWRQVGESFNPPERCTTISWSFRNFYEKVLLEYEKQKTNDGKLKVTASSLVEKNACEEKMGEMYVEEFEENLQLVLCKVGILRDRQEMRKRIPLIEDSKDTKRIPDKRQNNSTVTDVGPPADWVKINVVRTEDSYEVYALIPGLACEEIRVQSDPAGRLIITGQPAQVENPWRITGFKKVIVLPSRIDPSQTSASLNFHGRLYVSAAPEKLKPQ